MRTDILHIALCRIIQLALAMEAAREQYTLQTTTESTMTSLSNATSMYIYPYHHWTVGDREVEAVSPQGS